MKKYIVMVLIALATVAATQTAKAQISVCPSLHYNETAGSYSVWYCMSGRCNGVTMESDLSWRTTIIQIIGNWVSGHPNAAYGTSLYDYVQTTPAATHTKFVKQWTTGIQP